MILKFNTPFLYYCYNVYNNKKVNSMQSEVPFPTDEEVKIVYTPYKELKTVSLKEEEVLENLD